MIKSLLTGATALCLAASPVAAESVRTTSGSTAIQLNTLTLTPFLTAPAVNATLTPNGSAKLSKTGVLTIPITGGAIDLVDADGEIIHNGGIKISRLSGNTMKTVVFSNLMLEVKVSEPGVTPPVPATPTYQITGVVSQNTVLPTQPEFAAPAPPATLPAPIPMHRIALFTLAPFPATAFPLPLAKKTRKLVITGGNLALTDVATAALNAGLVLPSVAGAPVFTAGTVFGSVVFQAGTKKF